MGVRFERGVARAEGHRAPVHDGWRQLEPVQRTRRRDDLVVRIGPAPERKLFVLVFVENIDDGADFFIDFIDEVEGFGIRFGTSFAL